MKRLLLIFALAMPAFVVANDSPYASMDEPHGVIRGDYSRRAQDIFAVEFKRVDDQEFPGSRPIMYLTPGEHEIMAVVVATNLTSMDLGPRRLKREGDQTLTVEIEAGKTYHIGAKINRKGGDAPPWSLVLWKVDGD